MPIDIHFKVANYARVAKVAKQLSDGKTYRGYIRDTIQASLQDLRDYTSSIVHKETGTLSRGIEWQYDSTLMRGRLLIAPWAIKVSGRETLQWAQVYGVFEHRRGGEHAFFQRAMRERAPHTAARELQANIRTFNF